MNPKALLLLSVMAFHFTLRLNAQPHPSRPNLAATNQVSFQSPDYQVALLELFTSEGCSSCPPAEQWLSGLKESSALWKEFVPVAFHVDYWDYLGWRDPWASAGFSDRQRAYAALWHSDSTYTPGFVLNGKEWRPLLRPKDGPRSSRSKSGCLIISSADRKQWQISFSPAVHVAGNFQAHAALLAGNLTSEVKAGENRGRRLNHDFVVIALGNCLLKTNGDNAQGQFPLTSKDEKPAHQVAIAVWVTHMNQLEPLQAVGGWLTPENIN